MEISITIAELVIFLGGMLTVGLITSSNAKSIEKSKQASWESEKNELETSLNHLQSLPVEKQKIASELQFTQSQNDDLKKESINLKNQVERLQQSLAQQAQETKLQALELQSEQEKISQLRQDYEEQKRNFKTEFKALSENLLKERQNSFEASNQKTLQAVLSPIKQEFVTFKKQIHDVHTQQTQDQGALKNELANLKSMNSQLGERAEKLAQALRNDKKQLGNWGEVQLERLLESSGLDKSCYAREENYKSEDGDNLRPDFVIKLPEEKCLIIDSKVSLNSYVDSVNEEDAEAAELLLRNHISNIRNHIKGLAEKSYDSLKDINSPDFVFMFMPIESAYLAAFEADPRLFDFAYDKKIAVVTPNTLLPILRTVSSLWRIDRQNTSTLALAESATKVHTKLMTFLEKFLKLESQLQTAQKTFDDAKGNLSSGRGNLLNLVTDFENKGVKINKELPPALSTEG